MFPHRRRAEGLRGTAEIVPPQQDNPVGPTAVALTTANPAAANQLPAGEWERFDALFKNRGFRVIGKNVLVFNPFSLC